MVSVCAFALWLSHSTHRWLTYSAGPVGRSMALARRDGPDFLFLANAHSQKFNDLEQNKEVQISFQDIKTQEWASITGTATKTDNSDPRIKEVWSRGAAAWFGDLGDGKHTGGPEDPRMTLIEVKAKYIVYYVTDVGILGYAKEVIQANITGGVANTGKLRELKEPIRLFGETSVQRLRRIHRLTHPTSSPSTPRRTPSPPPL